MGVLCQLVHYYWTGALFLDRVLYAWMGYAGQLFSCCPLLSFGSSKNIYSSATLIRKLFLKIVKGVSVKVKVTNSVENAKEKKFLPMVPFPVSFSN